MPQDAWKTYRRLLGYVKPHRRMYAIGVLGMAMFAATSAAWVKFTQLFLDETFLEGNPAILVWVPVGLVGLFVVRGLGDFLQTYFSGYVGRRIVKRMREQIFSHFLHLPVRYFDRNASGTLLSRLTFNTEQVAQATTDSMTIFIRETLTIIGLLGYLLYMDWYLTTIALVTGPLIGWLISTINRLFRRYSQRIQSSMGDVTRVAKEAIEAPRVVKVFNAQAHELAQFEVANERNRQAYMKLLFTKGLSNPVVQVIAAIGLSVVLYVSTKQALAGNLTAGELTGFLAGLILITAPLRGLVNVAGPLQQGISAGQDIFALLDEAPEPAGGSHAVPRVRGEVEFRDVRFAYDSGKGAALNGVSFRVNAGETVAIVGRSGSGKSTLVNLLPRFYDPASGSILVDGRDIQDYGIHNLREQMALVSQDVVLFNDTIRANIAFGREASDAQIEEAAKAAHVMEFVKEKPEGLDTIVGDRGVVLSGGQKQRISIARALLKNAPILILDEATSALDTESERIIQAELEELMHNRTTLVIAHRLSTIENADRIVVMDAGRLVETGTHAELLARDGVYAQLHKMQFNA